MKTLVFLSFLCGPYPLSYEYDDDDDGGCLRGLTQKLVDTPGITKRGGDPFMGVAAREKSTGKKNSFT